MLGYHFTSSTLRDGSAIPPIGQWLEHSGHVVPCTSGLHMSEHPFDALQYAPGPLLHRVELEGDMQSHGAPIDKWCGRRRKIIATIDARKLLRRFAKDQALSVSHLWEMPAVVREYLESDSDDAGEWDAARAAAWDAASTAARDAARAAAWDAARDAAWDAARDAASAAAWAAARDAARDAASAAARDAARDAASAAQREQFAARVGEAFATVST